MAVTENVTPLHRTGRPPADGHRRPAGSPAGAARRRRVRRAGRHEPDQRPLPDRLHRFGRPAAGHRRASAVRHRRPVPRPVGRRARAGPGSPTRSTSRSSAPSRTPRWPRSCRGTPGLRVGLEADAVTWAAQRRWATDLLAGRPSSCPRAASSRSSAWSRTPVRRPGSARHARSPTRRSPRCAPVWPTAPTEAEFALELDTDDAVARGAAT